MTKKTKKTEKNSSDYRTKWVKDNCKQILIKFNKKADKDILDFLAKQENRTDFFRKIIRKEMKK